MVYKNEIDYIMSNKILAFKDVSVINNLYFNTGHRMVRTKLSGTYIKKARRFHNKIKGIKCKGNPNLLLNNLKITLENEERESTTIEEKYDRLRKQLKTETRKINNSSKNTKSFESKKLLQERKELLQQGKNTSNNRKKIAEISKRISEQLRKERNAKRLVTLKKHIERSGGIKKALKELNYIKKDWIANVKSKDCKKYTKDQKY